MKKRHVIITGPGRAGTSFLVQLLTHLGFDTGFTKDHLPLNKSIRAGLEYQTIGGDLPYIIKNPKLMWQLPSELEKNPNVVIDHVFIPLRDITAAVESRVENIKADSTHVDPRNIMGGLEGVQNVDEQKTFFLEKLYSFCLFLGQRNIPVTFLQYPALVLEPRYLYRKLCNHFHNLEYDSFKTEFSTISRPDFVHSYSENDVVHQSLESEVDFDSEVSEQSALKQESNLMSAEDFQHLRRRLLSYQQNSAEHAVLFFDDGNGFNPKQKLEAPVDICTTRLEFDLVNEKVKRVRFDPANHPVVIRLNSVEFSHDNTSYVPLTEHSTNASFVEGDLYYFLLPDSQIEFRSELYIQKVAIQIHYLALNEVDVFRVSAPWLKNLVNHHSELRKSKEYARHLEQKLHTEAINLEIRNQECTQLKQSSEMIETTLLKERDGFHRELNAHKEVLRNMENEGQAFRAVLDDRYAETTQTLKKISDICRTVQNETGMLSAVEAALNEQRREIRDLGEQLLKSQNLIQLLDQKHMKLSEGYKNIQNQILQNNNLSQETNENVKLVSFRLLSNIEEFNQFRESVDNNFQKALTPAPTFWSRFRSVLLGRRKIHKNF